MVMNAREQRGQYLAAHLAIQAKGQHWIVPSQSGNGKYTVNFKDAIPHCTCPDYELRGVICKHIYAVQYHLMQQQLPSSQPKTPVEMPRRKTYPQKWPAYNAAQTQEKALFQELLHALCQSVPDPAYTFGRPRLPLPEMVFAAAFKVYSTVSCRRFMTDLAEAHGKGFLSRTPHYNSIFNYLDMPEMTPILRSLIERSSLALKAIETNFAVDSSGFSVARFVSWYNVRYEHAQDNHDWIKAHLMCGVKTNIVTSVEITGRYTHDATQFEPLVNTTARNFQIEDVTADKAYLSRRHLEHVASKGGTAYIPFKSNSTGETGGSDVWGKLWHLYCLKRETFLEHYHQRSNVESTYSMIKAKFGNALRSKTDQGQINELLCKVLCHNICCVIQSMHELGIEAQF
jgi:transposase